MSSREDIAYDAAKEREWEDRKAALARDDVVGTVVGFICEQFGLMPDEVSLDTTFGKDLDADDFDRSDICGSCEDHYGFDAGSIPSKSLETVKALVDHICERLGVFD